MEKTFRCCDVCGNIEINGVPRIEKLTYYLSEDTSFTNDVCEVCGHKIVEYLWLIKSGHRVYGYWKDVHVFYH